MENTGFTLTREYIHSHKTLKGAWNKVQINALGLTWPPRQGWIDELEGEYISLANARLFEAAKLKGAGNITQRIYRKIMKLDDRQLELVHDFIDSLYKR